MPFPEKRLHEKRLRKATFILHDFPDFAKLFFSCRESTFPEAAKQSFLRQNLAGTAEIEKLPETPGSLKTVYHDAGQILATPLLLAASATAAATAGPTRLSKAFGMI